MDHTTSGMDPSRRDVLKTALSGSALAAVAACTPKSSSGRKLRLQTPNLIPRENLNPGTRDWLPTSTRIDKKTKYRCPWIEGYCSHTSLRAGDTIDFFIST